LIENKYKIFLKSVGLILILERSTLNIFGKMIFCKKKITKKIKKIKNKLMQNNFFFLKNNGKKIDTPNSGAELS
jgi:hypothetical protein